MGEKLIFLLRRVIWHLVLAMGPKINISFKIKPPLCAQVFRYANGGKKRNGKIKMKSLKSLKRSCLSLGI